jgi:hypothetical protein
MREDDTITTSQAGAEAGGGDMSADQDRPADALTRLRNRATGLSPEKALSLAQGAHQDAHRRAEAATAAGNEKLARSAEALAELMAKKVSQVRAEPSDPDIQAPG